MTRRALEKSSCLCVTENRAAFIPWLIWCFDRQTWTNKELVIVDSSSVPFKSNRGDIRVIPAEPGTSVAEKRNMATQAAHGKIITWFDDDDWQHPNKLTWLAEALLNGVSYAGSNLSWFLNINTNRCVKYHVRAHGVIFNSAGFLRETAQSVSFNKNIQKASDTYWMREIVKRFGCANRQAFNDKILFFWLCHDNNLSNPAKRKCFSKSLDELKKLIGPEAWGNTDEELAALRTRLANGDHSRRAKDINSKHNVSLPPFALPTDRPKQLHDNSSEKNLEPKNQPPVGLVIKATVMDAPFLDVMVRHMISQAQYPFAERAVIVDRQPAFSGKYHTRNRLSNNELDLILEKLVNGGIVDRVLDVDIQPQTIREIMGRYFTEAAGSIPLYAHTGGPIYATLFGMESVSSDYVLQMDADVFFYAEGVSWVKESLGLMKRDEQLWLMMTHPGPPAGPPGKSLGLRNARLAKWDRDFVIWRFRTATTRYFLCKKQKLQGRFRPLRMKSGIAPLEQMISHALQENRAYRGALGDLNSWHLHALHHNEPFPQWAAFLAKIIESGKYPPIQRGNYDLRLDLDRNRSEWGKILQTFLDKKPAFTGVDDNGFDASDQKTNPKVKRIYKAPDDPAPIHQIKNSTEVNLYRLKGQDKVHQSVLADYSPLAVVIPVRDRAGRRLKNTIASLKWQSAGPPAQLLIVSHGSKLEINRELSKICSEDGCELITIGDPQHPWNKPLALNVGIRATTPAVPFLMTMDVDMILAPNFLTVVLEKVGRKKSALILCRSSDLPQNTLIQNDSDTLKKEYAKLKRQSTLRPHWGPGGIQAAKRSFFFEVRGYDEDLRWWGAMDRDIVQRALLAGMKVEWIEDQTAMLHQWHPRKHALLTKPDEILQAKRAWHDNHKLIQLRSKIIARNPVSWGCYAN